jgi:hypothetical protein
VAFNKKYTEEKWQSIVDEVKARSARKKLEARLRKKQARQAEIDRAIRQWERLRKRQIKQKLKALNLIVQRMKYADQITLVTSQNSAIN